MSGERYFEGDTPDCPSCKREITQLEDYPRIRVGTIKVVTPPDYLDVPPQNGLRVHEPYDFGRAVNMVFQSDSVQEYLESLKSKMGLIVPTTAVLPPEIDIPVTLNFPWDAEERMCMHLFSDHIRTARVELSGVFGKANYEYYSVHTSIVNFDFKGLFINPELPTIKSN